MESPRTLKFLAVMFTVATAAFLALLVLDLVIGRPAAGDIFITGLNAVAAVWLWRKASEDARP